MMKNALAVLVAIALAQETINGGKLFVPVGAFQPASRTAPKIAPSMPNYSVLDKSTCTQPSSEKTSTTIVFMAPKNKTTKENNADEGKKVPSKFWENIGEKPGNLVMLPFVAIVGLDLLLNIVVLVKRSVEFFVFGQAPSTEPW